jgi:antitoxin HicB
MRNIVLYQDEDGMWCVRVPSLPGCFTQGQTMEEAIENAKDAITVYIESLIEDGLPVPEENSFVMQLDI